MDPGPIIEFRSGQVTWFASTGVEMTFDAMQQSPIHGARASGDDGQPPVPDDNRGLAVEEARPKLKKPPLFRVVLLNDDYTPMEFVVEVLELVFGMDRPNATRIMLEVHTKGKGICGVFTWEIAETKVAQVSSFAEQNQHPLMCTLEEL